MDICNTSDKLFRVLGHPLRLKIIAGLAKEPTFVKEIQNWLDLPQAVVSQHLAILKASGIIEGKRRGVQIYYAIVNPRAKAIIDCFD